MNTYYQNFQAKRSENKKNETEINRPFGEQLFPLVVAGTIGKGIIHVLSFCGAVILPAYGFDLLFGSFYIGLLLGFIFVLVFIEIPKWSVVATISENYFESGIISYGLALVALLFIAPSIASSTYGVPIAVWWLSPDAEIVNVIDIENKHNLEVNKAMARWEPQINKHSVDAAEYFEANKKRDNVTKEWRLSSSKAVKYPYNEMLKAEKEATKALNSRLDSIQVYRERDIQEAKAKNKTIVASHNFKKENAGNIAFWVMLCLEFAYVLIVFGLGYIKYRSRIELEGIEPNQPEQNRIVHIRTETNKTEQGQQTKKQAVAKERTIGFEHDQHGKIFTPQGATEPRVKYKKKKGGYAEYTKAELIRMANRKKGSDEFKAECKRLASTMD